MSAQAHLPLQERRWERPVASSWPCIDDRNSWSVMTESISADARGCPPRTPQASSDPVWGDEAAVPHTPGDDVYPVQ